MSYAKALRCRECGREYPLEPINVCEYCFGPVEVVYDYERLKKDMTRERITSGPRSIWRYKDLLPTNGNEINLGTGFTPLTRADHLGKALGLNHLYIKNDCLNPTYSFKDRVVSVAATKAIEFGFEALACASTGNLAGSVAAHGAKAGIDAYVFIPADLEPSKIVGAAIYGPTLVAVEGNYDEVNRLCSELADRYPWAFVNINIRPYYAEGCKTLGYEVAEQLGWQAPDNILVPVASGSLFSKTYKGLKELSMVGLIGAVRTRMHVAQALGSSPIVAAYEAHSPHIHPVKPKTIAKSLAIGNPADGYYALNTIKESKGSATAVSDPEVIEGIKLLAETEGLFAETAGGVAIASLKKLAESGTLKPDETTVVMITGAGFKTIEAVADSVVKAVTIKPTLTSFEQALGDKIAARRKSKGSKSE